MLADIFDFIGTVVESLPGIIGAIGDAVHGAEATEAAEAAAETTAN